MCSSSSLCSSLCSLMFILLILIFSANCYAKIQINIKVASSKGGLNVTFCGSDIQMISDEDLILYNVTDENVKKGIRAEFGATPLDVYLKDPTPYGSLYQKYKWQEVHRKVIVKSIVVQEIINEKILLAVHDHINNTPNKLKIPIKLLENVENSLKSTWSTKGLPDNEIYYDTRVDFFNFGQFTFENRWRNDSLKMVTLPFGIQTPGHIKIAPGKAITMKLKAKTTILLLRITYVAYLIGSFLANYPHLLGPYHFWAPSVASIMKAAKLNNSIITTETMELKIHTDPELHVFDKTTGDRIPIVFSSQPFRKWISK